MFVGIVWILSGVDGGLRKVCGSFVCIVVMFVFSLVIRLVWLVVVLG